MQVAMKFMMGLGLRTFYSLLPIVLMASAGLLAVTGCRRDAERAVGPTANTEVHVAKRDHFGLAVQYLFDMDATQRASDEAIYHLNRWLQTRPVESDWVRDPLIGRLIPELRDIKELQRLDRLQFQPADRSFIEECWWLGSIAEQALTQPLPPLQAAWIGALKQRTSAERKALEEACQLFDWTVRHIFLDPLLPYPRILSAGPSAGPSGAEAAPALPSMRGEPGPGYRFLPLQNLMAGRGDSLNRARIMLLLCRQRGLPAFVLGVDPGGTPRPRPWLCAVLIGKDLYLFDPEWGIPVPGKQLGSVATLAELRGDATWVDRMSAAGREYPHGGDDVGKLVALIDASPESLSQRMWLLQYSLPTKHAMQMTVRPSVLAQQLQAADSFFADSGRVRLWNLPFEAVLFQQQYKNYIRRFPQTAAKDARGMMMLQELPLLQQARRLHMMGKYNDERGKPGAKSLYLQARTPNTLLEQLPSSRELQRQFGVERSDLESPQQHAQRIAQHIEMRREAKYLASYWLAEAHYDSGMIDVSVNWWKDRTIDAFPDGERTPGAQYNLARCYEALGENAKAVSWLEQTDWPQQYGDRLRASWLKPPSTDPAPD